jgi:hypothetical protein
MVKKSRRSVYDPSVVSRQADDTVGDPLNMVNQDATAPNALGNSYREDDVMDISDFEIVDPKDVGRRPQRGTFCRKLLIAGAVILVVVVSILAIAAGSKKRPTNPTTSSSSQLAEPTDELLVLCNPAGIEEDHTRYLQCEQKCEPAECCDFPPTLDLSCLNDNAGTCNKYQQLCGVLKGSREENPAPEKPLNADTNQNRVDDLCSRDSLATELGFKGCKELCTSAACCWDDNAPMHCRGTEFCKYYEGCLNFKAITFVDPRIKSLIDTDCTADKISVHAGTTQCEQLCSTHKCCYMAGETCPFAAAAVCDQYSSCKVLNDAVLPSDQAVLPAYPSDLADQCFALQNAPYQLECKARCESAKCCDIPENMASSCLKNYREDCFDYHRACSALTMGAAQDEEIQLDEPPGLLADVCSPSSLASMTGHTRCHEQCTAAECCFSKLIPPGMLSCSVSQAAMCEQYSPCMNLEAFEFKDALIVQEVESQCTEVNLETPTGRSSCVAVCQQHTCCWSHLRLRTRASDDGEMIDDQLVRFYECLDCAGLYRLLIHCGVPRHSSSPHASLTFSSLLDDR